MSPSSGRLTRHSYIAGISPDCATMKVNNFQLWSLDSAPDWNTCYQEQDSCRRQVFRVGSLGFDLGLGLSALILYCSRLIRKYVIKNTQYNYVTFVISEIQRSLCIKKIQAYMFEKIKREKLKILHSQKFFLYIFSFSLIIQLDNPRFVNHKIA